MALKIAATVFVVGALAVWLITPIGNACPDVGRLPAGSTSSSSPSFSPPFTRSCTYTTPEGTQAHARYVPWLDWILLALLAAAAATVVRFVGTSAPRAAKAPKPRRERAPRATTAVVDAESEGARRERERAERAARKR